MTMYYNHVHLVGRIAADPKYIQATEEKSSKLVLVVAIQRKRSNPKNGAKSLNRTDFIPVMLRGTHADAAVRNSLKKGKEVTVIGVLESFQNAAKKNSLVIKVVFIRYGNNPYQANSSETLDI